MNKKAIAIIFPVALLMASVYLGGCADTTNAAVVAKQKGMETPELRAGVKSMAEALDKQGGKK